MKIILNKILLLFVAATLLASCDKEVLTELNPNAETTVSLSASDVVLDKEAAGQEVLTVSWTDPDYGFDAAAAYKVVFTAGEKSESIAAGTNLSKVFETVQLNKVLLKLGLKGGIPTEVSVQIQVVLSAYHNLSSNSTSFTATAYVDKLDLSSPWSLIGSAITGDDAGWGMDLPLYTTNIPDVFVAYVTLLDGKYKIRKDKSWDESYGIDGADIVITAGSYKITFNFNTKAISSEEFSWGIVGDATPIGWPGDTTPPDAKFTYDQYSDTWKVIIALKDGNIKFRQNNDWALNYGYSGVEGILGGDDIPVTAGNYIVTLDLNKLEYTLEKIDHIWGVVGDATPIGWPGDTTPPDAKLTIDFSASDDVWVIRNFTLKDGNIKFRADDDWGVNYGYSGVEGILGGDDIPVTAGTYDIFLNLSELTYELIEL
jgi:hypothetical protein